MECKQLLSAIDKLQENYVEIWKTLVNIESPTKNKADVDAASGYLETVARTLGFSITRHSQNTAGDVLVFTMNEESAAAPVVFSGHLDTVHPVGSFGTPAVTERDGKLYGPGVADCKGGVVGALMAMHALKAVGFTSRPVKLILQTDEETGSRESGGDTLRILVKEAKGAVCFLNCEATRGNSTVLRRKGILRYAFTVTGRSAHASSCHKGVSAIAEAAHAILALETFKDADGITCSVGTVTGGTAENVVPDSCTFTADFRYFTAEDLALVRRTVTELTSRSFVGGTVTAEEISHRPAMELTDENLDLLTKMNRIYTSCGLPALSHRLSLGGSDASYTTEARIPTADSIGVEGDFVHTPHEYAVISSLAEAAKRLAVVACFI